MANLIPQTEGEMEFRIQVSPKDCMGCSTCVDVCPKKVLHMKDVEEMVASESGKLFICYW